MIKFINSTFVIVSCTLFFVVSSSAQTLNDNYVKKYSAVKAISGDLSTVNDKNQVQESIEYYDGLGRPIQSISRQSSRLGFDIVTFWVYDSYGRKVTSYLPYVTPATDGKVKNSPQADQIEFYQNLVGSSDGSFAFSVQLVENSELQNVLKISAPGTAWQPNADIYSMADNTIKKRYEFNVADEVVLFNHDAHIGMISVSTVATENYYQPNQLYANKTYDEKNNEVIEYVDKEGLTICKKVFVKIENNEKQYAETYYIYDDLGNLVLVLPPEAVEKLKTALNLN